MSENSWSIYLYYYVIYLFMLPWRLRVKDPPVNAEVRYLGQEDPLEKELATHSRILAWRTPWTEEPGGL